MKYLEARDLNRAKGSIEGKMLSGSREDRIEDKQHPKQQPKQQPQGKRGVALAKKPVRRRRPAAEPVVPEAPVVAETPQGETYHSDVIDSTLPDDDEGTGGV